MKDILEKYNIEDREFEPYGFDKGKLSLDLLKRLENKKDGKLILVTAVNPTKAGEGKTTVSIGLAQGLKTLNKNVVLALREPSLGPVFGLKGGASGGGASSLDPEIDINLHFTGDLHAITSAHNLLSAMIDNHIYFGNKLHIKQVLFPRTMDMNDRNLRKIKTALRDDEFVITAASEIMAILALAQDVEDLKMRLSKILIGFNDEEKPIYAAALNCVDAMAILLKDAIKPNVVLAREKVLALVHGGPFANIAHGCNSVIATKTALKLGDYVVTEAGFGADLGMEKFLDIKLPVLGKTPDLVLLVVTIRALKAHGSAVDFNAPDINALERGFAHLDKHIENIKQYGLPFVVALNHFHTDTQEEIDIVINYARKNGYPIEVSKGFSEGGRGTKALAQLVLENINEPKNFKPVYHMTDDTLLKIASIAKKIYGAKDVVLSQRALKDLHKLAPLIENLPVCIAKTPHSFSGDASLVGRPSDFTLEITRITLSNGAGFIVARTKGINVMPGLNEFPRAQFMTYKDGVVKL